MAASPTISDKVVGRLSLYRRVLGEVAEEGAQYIYSHDLAQRARGTAAQVRRDLMTIGYTGSPAKGYDVQELLGAIGRFLDTRLDQRVALVGVGNLGRALLSYFVGRHPQFSITAAFDADVKKAGRVINGCPVYALEQLVEVVEHEDICLALITVPAEAAQETANLLCKAGVRGLLNFAPVRLWVPEGVHVENLDMTLALEKVAFFASARRARKGSAK